MTQIQFRRDTSTNFTSVNPVLASGEPAFETDTGKFKIGDGTTAYNSLDYIAAGDLPDNITTQGNTFNGANQLIKTDASGNVVLNGIIKSDSSSGIQSDRFAATGNQQVLGFGLSGSRVDVGWQDNYGLNLICNTLTLNDNAPNTAGGLVQLDSTGKLPAIDGSQLTNLPAATAPTNMVTTDTEQIITAKKTITINPTSSNTPALETDGSINIGGLNSNKQASFRVSRNTNDKGPRNALWSLSNNGRAVLSLSNSSNETLADLSFDDTNVQFITSSGSKTLVTSNNSTPLIIWRGTQTEYDGIAIKDNNTLYIITG